MLLTLANITHDAQKERRERLKQKYGDKTELINTEDAPPQRQSGRGHVAETSWSWGNPCKDSEDQETAALLQRGTGRGRNETAAASGCVRICKIDASGKAVRRAEADRRRQPTINI